MMESVNYREESHNTFFPSLLAFVRFSIWSLFNALFVLFVGQDSAFMDKFPTFHVELDQDETVTKPSMPTTETQYGDDQVYHHEVLGQQLVMYAEQGSTIDAHFVQAPQAEKKKNNRRKKVKNTKTEVPQAVQSNEQPKPVDDNEWIVVSSKKSSLPAKLPKEKKESKPKEPKKAPQVESKKNNTPPKNKEATQPKPKVQKLESGKSKVEAPVVPQQLAPIAHSMLKRNYNLPVEVPLVKPIRQPIGPPTKGGFGFSSEYRKSRMSAVMAH